MVNVDVRSEILRRAATGTAVSALAKEYKVDATTIYGWRARAKKGAKRKPTRAQKRAAFQRFVEKQRSEPTVFVRQGAPEVRLVVNGVSVYCAVSDLKAVLEVLK